MPSLREDIVPGLERLLDGPSFGSVLRWLASDDVESLLSLAEFGAAPYTRLVLHRDHALEVALVGWEPGQRSPIHDHGDSAGALRVLSGELVERRFRKTAGGVVQGLKRRRRRGALVREDQGTIHEMRNESPARAVTLHAYVPAISHARTYASPKRAPRLRWVAAAAALAGLGLAWRELRST